MDKDDRSRQPHLSPSHCGGGRHRRHRLTHQMGVKGHRVHESLPQAEEVLQRDWSEAEVLTAGLPVISRWLGTGCPYRAHSRGSCEVLTERHGHRAGHEAL